MDANESGKSASGYVQGIEALGGVFRYLAHVEAHDVRGVLNSISMAAYNSRARISHYGHSKDDADGSQDESFEAIKNKLDRIIEATKALDERVQLLVDLVSTKPADMVPTLRLFESVLPDLADPGFIEVRIDQETGGRHPRLSGVHVLAVLITWVNYLNANRGRLGEAVDAIDSRERQGGLIELLANDGGHSVLKLSPRGDGVGRGDVVVQAAFEAFAAVTSPHLPVVRIPLED